MDRTRGRTEKLMLSARFPAGPKNAWENIAADDTKDPWNSRDLFLADF
jgi:hypothetical protein